MLYRLHGYTPRRMINEPALSIGKPEGRGLRRTRDLSRSSHGRITAIPLNQELVVLDSSQKFSLVRPRLTAEYCFIIRQIHVYVVL